jgi:hypothetical protein
MAFQARRKAALVPTSWRVKGCCTVAVLRRGEVGVPCQRVPTSDAKCSHHMQAWLPRIRLHDLRHLAVMLLQGVPLTFVSEMLEMLGQAMHCCSGSGQIGAGQHTLTNRTRLVACVGSRMGRSRILMACCTQGCHGMKGFPRGNDDVLRVTIFGGSLLLANSVDRCPVSGWLGHPAAIARFGRTFQPASRIQHAGLEPLVAESREHPTQPTWRECEVSAELHATG